jgi:hypothetical protein
MNPTLPRFARRVQGGDSIEPDFHLLPSQENSQDHFTPLLAILC